MIFLVYSCCNIIFSLHYIETQIEHCSLAVGNIINDIKFFRTNCSQQFLVTEGKPFRIKS